MKSRFGKRRNCATLAIFFIVMTAASRAAQVSNTFNLTVSLPTPTMHVSDQLVLEVVMSNPTDHVVYAAGGDAEEPRG